MCTVHQNKALLTELHMKKLQSVKSGELEAKWPVLMKPEHIMHVVAVQSWCSILWKIVWEVFFFILIGIFSYFQLVYMLLDAVIAELYPDLATGEISPQ